MHWADVIKTNSCSCAALIRMENSFNLLKNTQQKTLGKYNFVSEFNNKSWAWAVVKLHTPIKRCFANSLSGKNICTASTIPRDHSDRMYTTQALWVPGVCIEQQNGSSVKSSNRCGLFCSVHNSQIPCLIWQRIPRCCCICVCYMTQKTPSQTQWPDCITKHWNT